jgi:opacity protein-like surface antigen
MRNYIIILLVILLIATLLSAQKVSKVGTTAAGFLNIDVSARAVGMGSSFAALSDDISAMYWNPAGIARIPSSEAMFCHNRWIADISFNFIGFAINLSDLGTLGLHATFVTMDPMERTTVEEPEGTGEMFDAGSYALGLAYARNLTNRFSIGFSFKYITEYIYNCDANGFAFDIGTLYETQFNGLKIGMSIKNYGTKMQMSGRDLLGQTDVNPIVSGNNANINSNLQTDRYDLPLIFRVGMSMDILKGMANSNFILAVDALHPNDDVEYLNLGGEYVFNHIFALRAGYKSLFATRSEEGLSFGGGIMYDITDSYKLKIDYAYQDFGDLEYIQMFTIGLNF